MIEKLQPIERTQCYITTATELTERLTREEAQYIAGLLDGEGAIFLRVHKKRQRYTLEIDVTIGVCHPMIIALCNKYGGRWYYSDRKKHKTKNGRPYKPFYSWEWTHPMIRLYFPQLLPFLRIKREQAEIMLKVVAITEKRKTGARTDEDREFFKKAQQALYNLNHKPYPCDISKYEHLKIYDTTINPKCPKCNSKTWKDGTRTLKQKGIKVKRFECSQCGHRFRVEK